RFGGIGLRVCRSSSGNRAEEGSDGPEQAALADHLQRPHSTLMPVALAMSAQRGASVPMNAAKSRGDPIFASAPTRARPACASLDLRISLTAPLSLLTISVGVPAVASRPDQNEACIFVYSLSHLVGTLGSIGEREYVPMAIVR